MIEMTIKEIEPVATAYVREGADYFRQVEVRGKPFIISNEAEADQVIVEVADGPCSVKYLIAQNRLYFRRDPS